LATRRSRFMRISDLVLDESWDDATLATVIRLLAWMRQRWARERISSARACEALISSHDAMRITNVRRPHVALQRLASLPLVAGLSSASAHLEATQSGSAVRLKWAKVAEYQGWDALDTDEERPANARTVPPPSHGARLPDQELHASHVDAVEPASPIDPLEKPLRLLSREPGSAEAKRAWMTRELPLLEAEAARQEPDNPKARSAAFRTVVLRFWRQYQHAPVVNGSARESPAQGRERRTKENARTLLLELAAQKGQTLGR